MKRVAYHNSGSGKSYAEYQIFNRDVCVFTGVTHDGTSTVNAAERIIGAIRAVERRPLKFYDLQTQRGYSYYKPGEYSFDLLILAGGDHPMVKSWKPMSISEDVLRAFCDHIGPNPRLRT